MVERVLRLPMMDDARAATRVFREVPLSTANAEGEVQGRADLLFEHDGQWRVVEFKTEAADPRKHQAQVASYAAVARSLIGQQLRVHVCRIRAVAPEDQGA